MSSTSRHVASCEISRPQIVNLIAAAPVMSRPGSGYRYSGPGYLVIARLIAAVSGVPYSQFVHARIIDAVGLSGTVSGQFLHEEPGTARGHRNGRQVHVSPHLSALPGTGDLWTTASDLNRWATALHSSSLLRAGSIAAMRHAHTRLPEPPELQQPIVATGYGYGTFLGTVLGQPAQFHTGDNPGYSSLVAWLPNTATAIAVLTNDDGHNLAAPLRDVVAPALA